MEKKNILCREQEVVGSLLLGNIIKLLKIIFSFLSHDIFSKSFGLFSWLKHSIPGHILAYLLSHRVIVHFKLTCSYWLICRWVTFSCIWLTSFQIFPIHVTILVPLSIVIAPVSTISSGSSFYLPITLYEKFVSQIPLICFTSQL